MSLVAVADLFGLIGRRPELLGLFESVERGAVRRAGCLRYTFAATIAEPDRFLLLSEWADQASLDVHYASREFASFQFALNGLLARPSEMTMYSVSGAVRPVASGPIDPRDAD
jgi:quinol monooxygenase YgiN